MKIIILTLVLGACTEPERADPVQPIKYRVYTDYNACPTEEVSGDWPDKYRCEPVRRFEVLP